MPSAWVICFQIIEEHGDQDVAIVHPAFVLFGLRRIKLSLKLKHNPNLQAVATHMNTLVLPPAASSQDVEAKQPTVILFATLFYHS
jgi:hypothetical protein